MNTKNRKSSKYKGKKEKENDNIIGEFFKIINSKIAVDLLRG